MVSPPHRAPGLLRRWILPGAAIALVVGFHLSPFGHALDHAFFDAQSRHPLWEPPLPATSAIVLIDEASMSEVGKKLPAMRWPFPRSVFAGLIAALDRAGAEKIVMDFTFFEHLEAAEQDLLLAGTAAAVRSTLLARTPEIGPVFWDQPFISAHQVFFDRPRTGDVTFNADEDGVSRHYPGKGSLGAAASNAPANAEPGLLRWYGGIESLQSRTDGKVPLLSAVSFLVRGVEIIRRVEAASPDYSPEAIAAALANEPKLTGGAFDQVRGRTVFVGANASGAYDVKSTPVGKIEPGLLLHWTAWTNLMTSGFTTEIPRVWSLAAGAFASLLVIGASVARSGIRLAGLLAVGVIAAVLGGSYLALSLGWFFPPATPVMAAAITLLGVAAESFWRERQRKLEIQAMFGSYVATSVVEQLMRDPNAIRLGGEKRTATVFFSDLADFTDLSEKIPPELLLQIINRYLQEVSDSLLEHGAYIDKYIGDAVMAVFGVPQPLPNHAVAACKGALAAQRVFRKFSDDIARQHGHRPHMRIGINTGDMIVGNMGSERKKNYTVLGDAVNLASRLESANKKFGTSILLGDSTARLVQESFVTRPLTRLRVKGRAEAVEVHELVDAPLDLDPARQAFVTAYCEGYRLFGARQFAAAVTAFTRANAAFPDDSVTLALLAEAQEYSSHPPAADWQPILILDSK